MSIERLMHIGLCVSDLARSRQFYCDALGFEERSDLIVAGAPVDQLLELDDVRLEAVYLVRDGTCLELLHFAHPDTLGSGNPRPMNELGFTHLSFQVGDLDAAVARLSEAGAEPMSWTRVDNPAQGARAVFVCDPDGTRIELVELRADA